MSDRIVRFPRMARLEGNPEAVLREALARGMDQVVVVGFDQEGREMFLSSVSDAGDVLYHLQRAIYNLNKTIDMLTER